MRSMGIVWKNGLSIEHPETDLRAAIMIDCTELASGDWKLHYEQQKAIERVGWKCLRVDVLSFLVDTTGTLAEIMRFLASAGVEPPTKLYDELEDDDEMQNDGSESETMEIDNDEPGLPAGGADGVARANNEPNASEDESEVEEAQYIVISSDDEDQKPRATSRRERSQTTTNNDEIDEAVFGNVVNLEFLRNRDPDYDPDDMPESDGDEGSRKKRRQPMQRGRGRKKHRRLESNSEAEDSAESGEEDQWDDSE